MAPASSAPGPIKPQSHQQMAATARLPSTSRSFPCSVPYPVRMWFARMFLPCLPLREERHTPGQDRTVSVLTLLPPGPSALRVFTASLLPTLVDAPAPVRAHLSIRTALTIIFAPMIFAPTAPARIQPLRAMTAACVPPMAAT